MRIALVAQNGSPLTPAKDPNTEARAAAVTSLAQALADLGHRTTIYARKDSPDLPGSVILARGVTLEHLTAGPQAPLAADELTAHVGEFGNKLAKRWNRTRPDIAHACSWTSGLAALAAARDLDIRVVQSFDSLAAASPRTAGRPDPAGGLHRRPRRCRPGRHLGRSRRAHPHRGSQAVGHGRAYRGGHGPVLPRRAGRRPDAAAPAACRRSGSRGPGPGCPDPHAAAHTRGRTGDRRRPAQGPAAPGEGLP